MRRLARAFVASVTVLALLAAAGCAHAPAPHTTPAVAAGPPAADSVTVALWHMDETGGTRVTDAGPYRLQGTAGLDTHTDFGRFGKARGFTRSLDSFILVPYEALLDPLGAFTVEAWVFPTAFGQYELTPIAACWTEVANEKSWLFAIVGQKFVPPFASLPSPGYHDALVVNASAGQLLFAYQPVDASEPLAFASARPIELNRWTHVAATFDGALVRFYIDGRLDAQYATVGRIRPSSAPLLIGNYFDTRRLSTFGGDLRIDTGGDPNFYYAYEGLLDELRLSNTARTVFESTRLR